MGLAEEERKGFDTLFNVDPDTREWNTPEVCYRSRCIQLYYVRQCFMHVLYIQGTLFILYNSYTKVILTCNNYLKYCK
jgi:hypothetical protein